MAGGHRVHADDMHILLRGALGHFLRRREQIADHHLEAQIREGGGDDLLAAVMAVLAELGDENLRLALVVLGEGRRHAAHARDLVAIRARLARIDAGNHIGLGLVAVEDFFQRDRRFRRRSPWRAPPRPPAPADCRRRSRLRSARRARLASSPRRARRAGASSLSICAARTAELSTFSTSGATSLSGRNLFTPTTTCCPVSMRACVFAATSSIRCLGRPAAIALAMPPRLSISSICVQAASASSAVSFST